MSPDASHSQEHRDLGVAVRAPVGQEHDHHRTVGARRDVDGLPA